MNSWKSRFRNELHGLQEQEDTKKEQLHDWFELYSKELNPIDPKKGLIPSSREKG